MRIIYRRSVALGLLFGVVQWASQSLAAPDSTVCAPVAESLPNSSLCGVTATYLALAGAGVPCRYADVLRAMPPSVYGNSMHQIVACIRDHGIAAAPVRCSMRDLHGTLRARTGAGAVINVGDHWVYVQAAPSAVFEIVDYPRKYRLPVDVVEHVANGYAVLVNQDVRSSSHTATLLISVAFTVCALFLLWLLLHRRTDRSSGRSADRKDAAI